MHIRKIEISNIRSIDSFRLNFPKGKEAGWHVLIGDNGSGKSSILRTIALALIGPNDILRLDPVWENWLKQGEEKAEVAVWVTRHSHDGRTRGAARGGVDDDKLIYGKLAISKDSFGNLELEVISRKTKYSADKYFWTNVDGYFSCAFGPFRRFTGGNQTLEQHYIRNPKIGSHLTAFKEDAALTEVSVWLKDIYTRSLEKQGKKQNWKKIYEGLLYFINKAGLLPEGFKFVEINADGPVFKDPNGVQLHMYQLSEGIKSILSLTFEMLRLMLDCFDAKEVFGNMNDDNPENDVIPVPGVVLIDEIDAHLHPTWQTRIGKWFTTYFPNIQFIVTTHSPLICRAASKGSIWRLSPPGSDEESKEVIGSDFERLVYGDVLDAYGTENFGEGIDRGIEGKESRKRYQELTMRVRYGNKLSAVERVEYENLKKLFQSHVEA